MNKLPQFETGIAHLILLLIVVTVISVTYLLFASGFIKNPGDLITKIQPKKDQSAQVKLQSAYKNPFDKSSQYVNPFASYKNPFDSFK